MMMICSAWTAEWTKPEKNIGERGRKNYFPNGMTLNILPLICMLTEPSKATAFTPNICHIFPFPDGPLQFRFHKAQHYNPDPYNLNLPN
jgi:hypothetical protein